MRLMKINLAVNDLNFIIIIIFEYVALVYLTYPLVIILNIGIKSLKVKHMHETTFAIKFQLIYAVFVIKKKRFIQSLSVSSLRLLCTIS